MSAVDEFGVKHYTKEEMVDVLYQNPSVDLTTVLVDDPEEYNLHVKKSYVDFGKLRKYIKIDKDIKEFDKTNQQYWFMPDEYKELDIADWVLKQCKCDTELQRSGEELLLFQDKGLMDLLRYMKYVVDTFRKNGIVIGVGRGSSVASFVLYLIGVHRINSIEFGLDIKEFLR